MYGQINSNYRIRRWVRVDSRLGKLMTVEKTYNSNHSTVLYRTVYTVMSTRYIEEASSLMLFPFWRRSSVSFMWIPTHSIYNVFFSLIFSKIKPIHHTKEKWISLQQKKIKWRNIYLFRTLCCFFRHQKTPTPSHLPASPRPKDSTSFPFDWDGKRS